MSEQISFTRYDKDNNPVECKAYYRCSMPVQSENGEWETKEVEFPLTHEDVKGK